jgi:hypothetical protein
MEKRKRLTIRLTLPQYPAKVLRNFDQYYMPNPVASTFEP